MPWDEKTGALVQPDIDVKPSNGGLDNWKDENQEARVASIIAELPRMAEPNFEVLAEAVKAECDKRNKAAGWTVDAAP